MAAVGRTWCRDAAHLRLHLSGSNPPLDLIGEPVPALASKEEDDLLDGEVSQSGEINQYPHNRLEINSFPSFPGNVKARPSGMIEGGFHAIVKDGGYSAQRPSGAIPGTA